MQKTIDAAPFRRKLAGERRTLLERLVSGIHLL
jgi:hypothetical protein